MMKNKAPLALIELTVMILIFALAAALCLQAFAWSELTSSEIQEQDQAVIQAETTAEVIKACGGDFAEAAELLYGQYSEDDNALTVCFDGDWQLADEENGAYRLEAVRKESGHDFLGTADISVMDREEAIFRITVCWQEVTEDGK